MCISCTGSVLRQYVHHALCRCGSPRELQALSLAVNPLLIAICRSWCSRIALLLLLQAEIFTDSLMQFCRIILSWAPTYFSCLWIMNLTLYRFLNVWMSSPLDFRLLSPILIRCSVRRYWVTGRYEGNPSLQGLGGAFGSKWQEPSQLRHWIRGCSCGDGCGEEPK